MASSKRAQLPPLQTTYAYGGAGAAGTAAAAAGGAVNDENELTAWDKRSRSRSRAASPVLTPSTSTTPFGEFGPDDDDRDERPFLGRSKSRQEYFELQSNNNHSMNGRPASFGALSSGTGNSSKKQSQQDHHHHVRSYSTSSNHHRRASSHHLSEAEGSISRPRSTNNNSRPASRNNARSPLLYNHHQSTSPSLTMHHYNGAISNSSSSSSLHSNHPSYRYHSSHIQALLQAPASFLRQCRLFLGIGTREWRDCATGCTKVPDRLRAYIPLLIWVGVSVAMALVIGIWHKEVFEGLDSLSVYLKSIGLLGHFILFFCIFLTTFPPLPLYSTFIILSGYSFGLLQGFIVSYTAALSGAVVVYLLSKVFLAQNMQGLLNKSQGLKKVVRAIERRPKLLYLIRLSPYPYNVMNVLLASSSSLSFACYFWCTALALPKLIVHVSIGTTLHNFASSSPHDNAEEEAREAEGRRTKSIAGAVGIVLCLGVLVYLLYVARKAVDEFDEEDEAERLPSMESDENLSNGIGIGRYDKLYNSDGQDSSADLNSVYIHSPSKTRKTSPARDKKEMSQINLSSTSDIFPHHQYPHQYQQSQYAYDPQYLRSPSIPAPRASTDGMTPQTPIYHRKTFERQDTSAAFQTLSRYSKRDRKDGAVEHLEHRPSRSHDEEDSGRTIVERLEDVAEHK